MLASAFMSSADVFVCTRSEEVEQHPVPSPAVQPDAVPAEQATPRASPAITCVCCHRSLRPVLSESLPYRTLLYQNEAAQLERVVSW